MISRKSIITLKMFKASNGKIEIFYKNVGYVPQSIFLMDDTIINNVAYGKTVKSFGIEKL